MGSSPSPVELGVYTASVYEVLEPNIPSLKQIKHALLKQAWLIKTVTLLLMFHLGLSGLQLTLTLPGPSAGVSGSLDSYCSLKPLCSGMGEVVPARTSPTLLPPSPRTVLLLSCFKESPCINRRDWHFKS